VTTPFFPFLVGRVFSSFRCWWVLSPTLRDRSSPPHLSHHFFLLSGYGFFWYLLTASPFPLVNNFISPFSLQVAPGQPSNLFRALSLQARFPCRPVCFHAAFPFFFYALILLSLARPIAGVRPFRRPFHSREPCWSPRSFLS